MLVQRAYKTELDPSDRQVTACRQHAGAARWAYNWGLRVKQERYKASKKSPPAIELHRELNALKKTEVPWMYQVSKCAPQEALWNLDAAFTNFFRRCALKKQGNWTGKLGYPRVKTEKKGLGNFRLTGRIVVAEKAIELPRLGRLRLKERGYLPTSGVQILSAIGDVGFYEFKRQVLYKANWYGSRVILADRWEPSSKRCSNCGWVDEDLSLSDRVYHCEQCGLVLDRDLNAAINLEHLAGSSSDSHNACGAAGSGTRRRPRVQLAAKKQEPNTEYGLSILG